MRLVSYRASNDFLLRNVALMLLLALLFFVSAFNVVAIPLATYRDRVHQCQIALDSLQAIGEDADETSREERISRTLADVRRLLPPTEKVEVGGPTLEVDNRWLANALQGYEDPSTSSERRKALLTETTERLGVLAEELAELENKTASSSNTENREEAKTRLASILRRDEYARKSADGNAISRLWRQFATWLRSLFPNSPQIDPDRARRLSQIAQFLVVGLALAMIAYVLWKFGPRVWHSKANRKKKGKREARVVLGERLEPDQTSADLLAEAEVLARDGQLRAAIRKAYIALLCELGDRKVLGLAPHKTNRDYLRSLRNQEELYQEMLVLTNSFEIHWYGFIPANMDDWNMFRAGYHQALRQ